MNGLFIDDSAYCTELPLDSCGQVDWSGMVDPQLNANLSPSHCSDTRWNNLPMQRFIYGSSQTRQSTPQNQSAYDVPLAPGQAEYLFELASTSGVRHGSPFSQPQSSTCSSGQSPPADNDFYLESLHGPATPQDMAVASPYVTSNQYDHWDGQYQRRSVAEQAFMPVSGCVDPSSLAPSAVKMEGYHELTSEANLTQGQDQSFDNRDISYRYENEANSMNASPHLSSNNFQLDIPNQIHVQLPSLPSEGLDKNDQPYDGYTSGKQLGRRKRPHRNSDTQRRVFLKRQHNKQAENMRQSFTSHGEIGPRRLSMYPNGIIACDLCSSTFKDETLLRKHKRTEHIRPFTCVFHYAGCNSSFAAKNEWKRHVASQHLSLFYWLCTHGNCAHSRGPSTHQRSSLLPSFGVIFNRKDLFTQHIRRMHSPEDKEPKGKGTSPQVEERLKAMQEQAFQRRCHLPTYMRCPAQNCTTEFHGAGAWDERMEHVARHLEAAAVGDEPPVQFGGHRDTTLTYWAESPGVEVVKRTATGWEMCNPLKGEGGMRKTSTEGAFGTEQDAEGEVC